MGVYRLVVVRARTLSLANIDDHRSRPHMCVCVYFGGGWLNRVACSVFLT